ncbi:thiamine pyrophosphate-binding protein [Flammeovirga pectinis]|uniref:Thiamine pyrophosphate-binding protein n=1 Tax=Flammeovirga pectinis TaxID=2494373 RepID=A0A3Q9FPC1_9BACT|nr:thiamine pyrophosphate-binding protein [Flammeovirga pectinis]AZQ64743.1 thiamine pyrophosphate-binding protein [Flammeovirga pectinis]
MKNTSLFHQFLTDNKIQYIFGNPGTTETPIMNALEGEKEVEYILGLQENSVIGIAAGYALASENIAMVNIHTYPGLANAMCNLYSAYRSKIPLLITAGQQDRKHLSIDPILSGPLTDLASTATKSAKEIHFEGDFQFELQRAINIAKKAPEGPTFVSIPMDTVNAEVGTNYRTLTPIKTTFKNEVAVESIRELLLTEKQKLGKVVLLVDGIATNANKALIAFAENIQADIYSTPFPVKIPVPSTHYLYKGAFPAFASKQQNTLEHYDLIFVIGDALDSFLFDDFTVIPKGKTVVQINTNNDKVGEYFPVNYSLIGAIKPIFENLNQVLKTLHLIKTVDPEKEKKHYKVLLENQHTILNRKDTAFKIDRVALEVVSKIKEENDIVLEASSYEGDLKSSIKREKAGNVYTAPRGGGLGWGMPVAIGLSLATKKHSVCFVGDGGFQYSLQAIYTAKKYSIPVVFIVLNNGAYKVLKELWKYQFPKTTEEDYHELDLKPEVDILAISKGYGAATFNPKDYKELNKMMEEALKIQGPSVINVKM